MKQMLSDDAQLLTASDVAKLLGVSYQTPLRWARRGAIPSIRLPGGQIRYRLEDIAVLL